ncbi:MAG: thermopsin, partial [TACK group archaeon]|nr:thermopsin [TACK group archaeon]
MDSAQFSNFESTGAAQALYHSQGSYVEANIGPFTNGTYYLVIDNDVSSQQVNVNYTLSILPVDIYEVHSSLPSAVGITDYGVLNASGVLKPYRVLYNEVIGSAEIYSIKAYNSSPPSGIPAYGASLQQNVVLQVNTTTGDYVYWLQNVVGFITDTQTMNVWDNIWNYTSYPSYLYSENITGNGRIQQSSGGLYYAYGATSKPYSLPLDISLYISVERYQNSVRVNFGYTIGSSSVNWYDSVTIYQSGITSASLVISGYRNTPKGMFYDSELVFGGYGNGERTDFTQMDAELFMKYILDNGSYASPIQLYGFGSDTAEAADDLTTLL